jgi:hypothetical protein
MREIRTSSLNGDLRERRRLKSTNGKAPAPATEIVKRALLVEMVSVSE